ncbi:nucleotidyl transferase AbiEii/AbiGii toxin family protein [Ureibacillus chungkukjangi]|nr:nucleotidyl transferase AbiEii/AbiGii toxin family protein [Ureibacillus chungkukjangi]
MLQHILIETMFSFKPYPCEDKFVSNYITKYLEYINRYDLIEEYDLQPFNMRIQTIERTFLDKLFAVCDYHHDNDYKGKSRHIYDIHKIYQSGLLNIDMLHSLVDQVIETRREGKNTHSCKVGYKPLEVLQDIINSSVYKADYNTNTREFLSVFVEYETAIASLQDILGKGWIPVEISEQSPLTTTII